MEPWAAAKRALSQCGDATTPPRVPSQRPLALSVSSVTSVVNDEGDNEMIPGTVHISLSICPKTEENPGNPQLGDCR